MLDYTVSRYIMHYAGIFVQHAAIPNFEFSTMPKRCITQLIALRPLFSVFSVYYYIYKQLHFTIAPHRIKTVYKGFFNNKGSIITSSAKFREPYTVSRQPSILSIQT